MSSEAAMTSLPTAETAEKTLLFCELAKMTERLFFDGEKNESNALQSNLSRGIRTEF